MHWDLICNFICFLSWRNNGKCSRTDDYWLNDVLFFCRVLTCCGRDGIEGQSLCETDRRPKILLSVWSNPSVMTREGKTHHKGSNGNHGQTPIVQLLGLQVILSLGVCNHKTKSSHVLQIQITHSLLEFVIFTQSVKHAQEFGFTSPKLTHWVKYVFVRKKGWWGVNYTSYLWTREMLVSGPCQFHSAIS